MSNVARAENAKIQTGAECDISELVSLFRYTRYLKLARLSKLRRIQYICIVLLKIRLPMLKNNELMRR